MAHSTSLLTFVLLVDLEFVDEHAAEVASFFFAQRGVGGSGLDCGVRRGFVLGMKLFSHSRRQGRGKNG